MKTMFIVLLLPHFFFTTITAKEKCSNESPPHIPKYHLMEKCHRSKLGIAAKAGYTSLTSCQRLGIEKKALALNFSPPEAAAVGEASEPLEYTCEVLKCAEADGGLSLVNDTRYDYYSIYAKPLPDVNSTCVPATGMFYLLSKKLNYTQAQLQCKNMSSVLADVTSEQRSDALSNLLTGANTEAAFVGLRRTNNTAFIGVNGDSLSCTTYRAWAPGHPRRYSDKFDCVVVTRSRMWRSVPCAKRYPALCELVPGGPYRRGALFASRRKNDTDIKPTDKETDEKKEN